MAWLTWQAKYNPHAFSQDLIKEYDIEMKALLPSFVASRVLVAVVSKTTSNRLKPLVDDLLDWDRKIAITCTKFSESPEVCKKELADYHPDIVKFDDKILSEVADLIATWPSIESEARADGMAVRG